MKRLSLDRRLLVWDPEMKPGMFRHPETPNSFHLTSLHLSDVLVTMYQPRHRPFTLSIFNGSFNTLRKQWLFYDLISETNGVVGMFDGCLFSLHRPQMLDSSMNTSSTFGGKMVWILIPLFLSNTHQIQARLRVDGINISHIQSQLVPSASSPIAWIRSGKMDAVLDFHFPQSPSDSADLPAILSSIATNISEVAMGRNEMFLKSVRVDDSGRVSGQKELARPALEAPDAFLDVDEELNVEGEDIIKKQNVQVDIELRFRDIKAVVPLFQNELSYANSALIRPIVAFMK
jgi:distribution and morphology protein 31